MLDNRDLGHMDNDTALIMSIKTGDKTALKELVEKHKRTAYRMALGLVGNRDDAFDISQEAFLRVYRSAETFDNSKPFLPWFYTIVANLSRTWLKRRSNRDSKMVDITESEYLVVSDDNPEAALIQKEAIQNLRSALRELPFDDREIIVMQHFRGMSYDEISDILNIPKGTVMSRLYYARKKLAQLMRPDNGR